jgi:cyclopropane fatty-acyl-phospholipid synthase-like methyltransferase
MSKTVWQEFFDNHAPGYMENVFTKNTEFEVEFIIRELGLVPGNRILDVGCGTGRHCIPLALRGMKVTGIDHSEGMLEQARKYAEREKASVELIQADASRFSTPELFDHAICLCEGAMGLLNSDKDAAGHDLSILENISNSLKSGGKLLMTVLNGLKKIREHTPEDVKNGIFDPVHLVTREKMLIETDGEQKELQYYEKGFTAGELFHIIKLSGMEILHLWGGTAGSWNKQNLQLDEYEIMVIAQKGVR